MNIDKLVGKELKFDSLAEIVDHWNKTFGKKGSHALRRDQVVEFCGKAKKLDDAIYRACQSRGANGKMHNHQSRVKEKDRQKFAHKIEKALTTIAVSNFDELHDLLEKVKPPGIGPVTVYDVATRIAAHLKFPVKSLYLHAGVRIGLYVLYDRRYPDIKRIERAKLPAEFAKLPADEIEDLLCTYRDKLQPWYKDAKL